VSCQAAATRSRRSIGRRMSIRPARSAAASARTAPRAIGTRPRRCWHQYPRRPPHSRVRPRGAPRQAPVRHGCGDDPGAARDILGDACLAIPGRPQRDALRQDRLADPIRSVRAWRDDEAVAVCHGDRRLRLVQRLLQLAGQSVGIHGGEEDTSGGAVDLAPAGHDPGEAGRGQLRYGPRRVASDREAAQFQDTA
jgi:hypothetical protein